MKWVLLSAVAFALPIYPMNKIADHQCCCPPPLPEPKSECDPDLFRKSIPVYSGHVEFLYWSLVEPGLDYALKMRQEAWGPSPSYAQGRYENGTFGWDPGFRLALSYFRAPHYWEMKWQYTRMTCRGRDHASKPSASSKYLTGTWPQVTEAPLASAKSSLHFNYNVLDWMVDRVFIPNPHLRLRLWGAASGAWMSQDWKVRYYDSTSNVTTIRNRWNFAGGGMKTGTAVDWFWTGELYVTGYSMFGLFLGSYSNSSKQTTTVQPTGLDNPSIPIRNASYHDIRPAVTAQVALGPSWQRNYSCSRFELFAGFEMNCWFNLQEIYRSTAGGPFEAKETWVNGGVMTLYGLTTRLTVDF